MKGAVLVIDTCGERAGVALAVRAQVREVTLSARGASSEIVAVVRGLLLEAGLGMADVAAVGVVRGPGSFTGVRAGLAAAKGLCEAAGVRLVAVSRLAVLAEAAKMVDGLVALDAGRGQLYLREQRDGTAREWLGDADAVKAREASVVVVTEEKVAAQLHGSTLVRRSLCAADALPSVMRAMEGAVEDAAEVDALYLREEKDIYSGAAKAQG
jgi:tRNA threonylcarbamoyladenosine biosynthesis protein TsaB